MRSPAGLSNDMPKKKLAPDDRLSEVRAMVAALGALVDPDRGTTYEGDEEAVQWLLNWITAGLHDIQVALSAEKEEHVDA